MCESEGLEHKQRGVANLLSTKRPVCGWGVVCTRLPRGRLYTSTAGSSVHVYLLSGTVAVTKGSEVAMLFCCGSEVVK